MASKIEENLASVSFEDILNACKTEEEKNEKYAMMKKLLAQAEASRQVSAVVEQKTSVREESTYEKLEKIDKAKLKEWITRAAPTFQPRELHLEDSSEDWYVTTVLGEMYPMIFHEVLDNVTIKELAGLQAAQKIGYSTIGLIKSWARTNRDLEIDDNMTCLQVKKAVTEWSSVPNAAVRWILANQWDGCYRKIPEGTRITQHLMNIALYLTKEMMETKLESTAAVIRVFLRRKNVPREEFWEFLSNAFKDESVVFPAELVKYGKPIEKGIFHPKQEEKSKEK